MSRIAPYHPTISPIVLVLANLPTWKREEMGLLGERRGEERTEEEDIVRSRVVRRQGRRQMTVRLSHPAAARCPKGSEFIRRSHPLLCWEPMENFRDSRAISSDLTVATCTWNEARRVISSSLAGRSAERADQLEKRGRKEWTKGDRGGAN